MLSLMHLVIVIMNCGLGNCGSIWDKVFKNGPSKICERQPLKNLKGYGRLSSTNFVWSILEYFVPYFLLIIQSHRTIIYEMQSKPLSQVLVYIAIYCIFEITCYN